MLMEDTNIANLSNIFIGSFQELITGIVVWLPKLVIALIIWWLGRLLLEKSVVWVKKIDIPNTDLDDRIISKFTGVFLWLGKFILVLVILDYLGIGQTIISAIANGLTLTIAIALGISFGLAFQAEASRIIEKTTKFLKKRS